MTDFPQRENQTSRDNPGGAHGSSSLENVKDAASRASEKIGDGLNEAAAVLKTKALGIVEPVKDHAVHVAEEQIGSGAAKVEGIARAVHEAAD